MKIDHVALYVADLETMRAFYETYFGGISNAMYHNPRTGLKTYFLTFGDGARLELMTRPGLLEAEHEGFRCGFTHLAMAVGSAQEVDALTERLNADGFSIISGPRVTGDGYYESCVLDPEGNQIEITG